MTIVNILGLDIGERRIGVARTNLLARIPQRLATISNDEHTVDLIKQIIAQEQINKIVVGYPRNLSGEETSQTQYVKEYIEKNIRPLGLEIVFQDETLSSVEAEKRLSGKVYSKEDIDAEAAVIILEDFLKGINHDV